MSRWRRAYRVCLTGVVLACSTPAGKWHPAGVVTLGPNLETCDDEDVQECLAYCEAGKPLACFRASRIFREGIGIALDVERAQALARRGISLLQAGCSAGNESQCNQMPAYHVFQERLEPAELAQLARAIDVEKRSRFPQGTASETSGDVARGQRMSEGYRKIGELSPKTVHPAVLAAARLHAEQCRSLDRKSALCPSLAFLRRVSSANRTFEQRARILADIYVVTCAEGQALACARLAALYWHGIGMSDNLDTAVRLIYRSCGLGNRRACGYLELLERLTTRQ